MYQAVMIKSIVLLVIISCFFIAMFSTVFVEAKSDITIKCNGTEIEFSHPPLIKNGRTLAPLAEIEEALGVQINWNEEDQSITFRNVRSGRYYYLEIDRFYAFVEGEGDERNIILDSIPPTIINGTVYIPVRYFSEMSGFDVDWDENTKTVIITKLTHVEGLTAVITYINNEGIGQAPPPYVFILGQTVKSAKLNHPRDVYKLDHTFDGWMDPVTGIIYPEGEAVSFDTNVNLYAAFTNVFSNETVW